MAEISVGATKTITLAKLVCQRWIVDLAMEKVTAEIAEVDDQGNAIRTFEVTFWKNMPAEEPLYDDQGVQIGTVPHPETWFDLPAARATQLLDLTDEILAAVKARMY